MAQRTPDRLQLYFRYVQNIDMSFGSGNFSREKGEDIEITRNYQWSSNSWAISLYFGEILSSQWSQFHNPDEDK